MATPLSKLWRYINSCLLILRILLHLQHLSHGIFNSWVARYLWKYIVLVRGRDGVSILCVSNSIMASTFVGGSTTSVSRIDDISVRKLVEILREF